jgi:PAB-dependent poly(A)-specific ribonuclease subunit 3
LEDEAKRGTAGSLGYPSVVYKVVGKDDGQAYALRRVDNIRTTNQIVNAALEMWRRVSHPNIVKLRMAFTQQGALFFIRDYFPGALTIRERYMLKRGQLLPEQKIWSYIAQVVALSLVLSLSRPTQSLFLS